MLTPNEKNQLDELMKKKNNYVPLTEKEINVMDETTKSAYEKFHNAFMASQPFWHDMCAYISTLSKHNTRLLMEIEYLKNELTKKEANHHKR